MKKENSHSIHTQSKSFQGVDLEEFDRVEIEYRLKNYCDEDDNHEKKSPPFFPRRF